MVFPATEAAAGQWAVLSWLAEEGRLADYTATLLAATPRSNRLLAWALRRSCPWHEAFLGRYNPPGGRAFPKGSVALAIVSVQKGPLEWAVARAPAGGTPTPVSGSSSCIKLTVSCWRGRCGTAFRRTRKAAWRLRHCETAEPELWSGLSLPGAPGIPAPPWRSLSAKLTRESGMPGMLRWAVQHGCPWHPEASVRAAQCSEPALSRWALANCCPMEGDTVPELTKYGKEEWLEPN